MIKPQQLETGLAGALLRGTVIVRPDQESASRPFLGRIWQPKRLVNDAVFPQHRTAAFVRKGVASVSTNRRVHLGLKHDRHQFVPPTSVPSGGFSQKRSDK